jgi:hypothetical protein
MRCRNTAGACPLASIQVAITWLRALCIGVGLGIVAVAPTIAQHSGPTPPPGTGPGGIFELSSAIPGTSEYHMERRARQLSAMLGDLEPVISARVVLTLNSDDPDTLGAAVQLQTAANFHLTIEFCQTVVSIIQHIEPRVATGAILLTDRQGRVLFDNGRPVVNPDAMSREVLADSERSEGAHTPFVIVGLLLGLAAFAALWIYATRRSAAAKAPPVRQNAWSFLHSVHRKRLAEFLSQQRPELVGAVYAQLDEHDQNRLKREFRSALDIEQNLPQRPMHPEIAQMVAASLQQALACTQPHSQRRVDLVADNESRTDTGA